MTNLLKRVLVHGHQIAIANGKLEIITKSGREVPLNWLKKHQTELIQAICCITGTSAWQFEGYSTGRYGAQKFSGISLQFTEIITHEPGYCVFNADLNRTRNTTTGKKGTPLPRGQFRVGKRSLFYKLWLRCRLPPPPRISSFHDYMGNLRSILLTADMVPGEDEKLAKETLQPLNISCAQIRASLGLDEVVSPDKLQTTARHHPDNCHTSLPDKKMHQHHESSGLQPFSTTDKRNYGSRQQGSMDTRHSFTPPSTRDQQTGYPGKAPAEQTNQEWLDDWENALG